MKCPNCHKDNPDDVKFCTGCGFPLAYSAKKREPSRAGKAAAGIAKAILYIFVMLGVQYMVASFYTASAMLADGKMMYELDYNELMQRISQILFENITMITLVSNLITILVLSVFFALRKKNLFEEASIRPVTTKAKNKKTLIPVFILYGMALNIFISVSISFIPLPESMLEQFSNQYAGLYGQTSIFVEILNTAVVTGILEEIIFRGLVFSRLKRGFSRTAAIIISAVMFGLCHGALVAICYATLLGILFALIADKYDSIVPTMICHVFFNFTSFLLVTENTFIILALYFISIAVLIAGSYLIFEKD